MKVIIRADASIASGTGHVMRCLTLAETLTHAQHEVILMTAELDVPWLNGLVEQSGVKLLKVDADSLDLDAVASLEADWLIVDSYVISADLISRANEIVPVLALVDSDSRGIEASLFLDQNFGAERLQWPAEVTPSLLAGTSYALIRDSVLNQKREEAWKFRHERPHVMGVMGGSDPTGTIVHVARAIAALENLITATLVVAPQWWRRVHEITSPFENIQLVLPTPDLGPLYGDADLIVSAAGSSSWEICTLGIPAVLIAVVDNQQTSLGLISDAGLALTVDNSSGSHGGLALIISDRLNQLIEEPGLRRQLSTSSSSVFDGRGKYRVLYEMQARLGLRGSQQLPR